LERLIKVILSVFFYLYTIDWFNYEILNRADLEGFKRTIEPCSKELVVFIDSSIDSCFGIKKEFDVQTIFLPSSKRSWESFFDNTEVKDAFTKQNIHAYETLDKVEWHKIGNIFPAFSL